MKGLIREPDLLKMLDLTRAQLDELRLNQGFPFVAVNKTTRVYFESSVRAWLVKNEKNQRSQLHFNTR